MLYESFVLRKDGRDLILKVDWRSMVNDRPYSVLSNVMFPFNTSEYWVKMFLAHTDEELQGYVDQLEGRRDSAESEEDEILILKAATEIKFQLEARAIIRKHKGSLEHLFTVIYQL